MISLDELQQKAAENKVARFAAFLEAIAICAQAEEMGPGAKSAIAEHIGYHTRTVTQLAAMHDLPEDCIDLDAKPSMYWAAIQHAPAPIETIRHALREGWTTAGEIKKHLGITNGRKPPLLVSEVDVVEVEPGQMVIRCEQICPEDKYPPRANLRLSQVK